MNIVGVDMPASGGRKKGETEAKGERGVQTSDETWVKFGLAGSKQALILLPVFVEPRNARLPTRDAQLRVRRAWP